MKITFNKFLGTADKFDDEQLADGYAVKSVNTRTGRSILEPWKASTDEAMLAGANNNSIFKYRTKWFSWVNETYAIKAPLKNDPYDYAVIVTDGVDPQMTDNILAETGVGPYPSATIPLGVPVPQAPTITSTEIADDWVEGQELPDPPPTDDEYDIQNVAYAICYEDAYGRLSALSEASDRTSIKEYDYRSTTKVTLQIPAAPTGLQLTNTFRNTTAKVRIFRTNFGGQAGVAWQLLDVIEYTESNYTDTTYSGDLSESPINDNWLPPPDTNTALFPNGPMKKVVVVGADGIAGHNSKIVCFAEPGAFYAYPPDYYHVFQEDIVTIVPSGSNLLVLTNGHPYILQGGHPASMDATRLPDPIPCASSRAVTEVFGAVFFASEVGLWQVEGYSPKNVSKAFLTDREWRELNPSSMVMANYDGRVFIYSAAADKTIVYDPSNPSDGLREVDISVATFAQMDHTNDLAYVPVGSDTIKKFDSLDNVYRPMQYVSKTYDFNAPIVFPVMKVKAYTYPVTITVEADDLSGIGTQSATRVVNNADYVYLPFQRMSKRWRIKVAPDNATDVYRIRSIELAESAVELS